jgi:hypothetical protein
VTYLLLDDLCGLGTLFGDLCVLSTLVIRVSSAFCLVIVCSRHFVWWFVCPQHFVWWFVWPQHFVWWIMWPQHFVHKISVALHHLQSPNRPLSSRTVPFNCESLAGLRVACQTTVAAAVRNGSLKLPRTWYQLVKVSFTPAKISFEGPEIYWNYLGCLQFTVMSGQQFAAEGKLF